MFKLKKMAKVRIITTEKHRKELINTLYSFGIVQVVSSMEQQQGPKLADFSDKTDALYHMRDLAKKHKVGEGSKVAVMAQDGRMRKGPLKPSPYSFGMSQIVASMEPGFDKPLAEYSGISDALVYLRGLLRKYDLGDEPEPHQGDLLDMNGCIGRFTRIKAALQLFEQKIADAREKYDNAHALVGYCSGFEGYPQSVSEFFSTSSVSSPRVMIIRATSKNAIERIISGLYKTNSVILENKDEESESAPVALLYDANEEQAVLPVMGGGVEILAGPFHIYKNDTFHVLCQGVRSAEELAQKQLEAAEAGLKAHIVKNKADYLELVSKLETLSNLSTLPLKFTKADKILVVECWVPEDVYLRLEQELNAGLGNVVQVSVLETKEQPPTLMDNPQVARPFEYLLKFFSLPRTGEIDPTVLVAFTFPLFFGIILGDIGYGILGLLLALFVRSKSKPGFFGDFSNIMVLSSISSIVFGFVFAEFFGKEDIFGYAIHPMIMRVSTVGTSTMIGVCLAIGALHMFLGFVLGAINGYLHHDRHHMWAKMCWVVFEASAVVLALVMMSPSMFGGLPVGLITSASEALVALSLLGILKLEGIAGGIEIFSLVSNIFSYLRIIALGLSGAILAMVINAVPVDVGAIVAMINGTAPFDAGAIISIVLFALLFLVGHLLAFGLALFECSIQSLRLHYVEFFSKFYHGGGSGFSPLRQIVFGKRRRGLDNWKARQSVKKARVENRYLHRGVM